MPAIATLSFMVNSSIGLPSSHIAQGSFAWETNRRIDRGENLCLRRSVEQAQRGARDVKFLVERNYVDRDARLVRRNARLFAAAATIALAIDLEAHPFEIRANALPNEVCVLADAATEDHRFHRPGYREICAEVFARAMTENLDRKGRARFAFVGGFFKLAQII